MSHTIFHSYVRHDAFICMMSHTIFHSYVRHDAFICMMSHTTFHSYVRHDSHDAFICMTWHTMIHWYICNHSCDSLWCDTLYFIHMYMTQMLHSYVWHTQCVAVCAAWSGNTLQQHTATTHCNTLQHTVTHLKSSLAPWKIHLPLLLAAFIWIIEPEYAFRNSF